MVIGIEKPQNPPTNLVIEGVYYSQNSELLFHCLDEIIKKDIRTHNEYQLTDGLQLMVEYGERMKIEFINSLQLSKLQLFTECGGARCPYHPITHWSRGAGAWTFSSVQRW